MRLPPSSSLAPSSALLSIHLDPRIQAKNLASRHSGALPMAH
jgi:hypothetical protein